MYTEGFQIAKESLSGKGLKALTTLQELSATTPKGSLDRNSIIKTLK
jgi:hypothetical protein